MPGAPAMGAEIAKQRASVSHLMVEIVAQDALGLCGLYRLPYVTVFIIQRANKVQNQEI